MNQEGERTKRKVFSADENYTLIATMNTKGGVGKTTISSNFAFDIAYHSKHNVLLVEADNQCNLQPLFHINDDVQRTDGDVIDDEDEDEDDVDEGTEQIDIHDDAICRRSDRNYGYRGRGAYSYHPNTEPGTVNIRDQARFSLYECFFERLIGRGTSKPITMKLSKTRSGGDVYLLPGTPTIKKMEHELIKADTAKYGQGHKTLAIFKKLILEAMDEIQARVAVVDFGPHGGFLNRVMVMSCDLIIPPAFADFMSYQSSSALLNDVLPDWYKWYNSKINSQYNAAGDGEFYLKRKLPIILPFVVSNFPVAKGKVQRAAAQWIKALELLESDSEYVRNRQITLNEKHAFMICPTDKALLEVAFEEKRAMLEIHTIPTKLGSGKKRTMAAIRSQWTIYTMFIIRIINEYERSE